MSLINTKIFTDFNTTFYSEDKMVTDNSLDSIQNSISNIIFTSRGEKVGDPEFGCDINTLLFRPMDGITEELLSSEIYDSIERYEDRIEINEINITGDENNNYYKIDIIYTITKTPDIKNKYVSVLKRL